MREDGFGMGLVVVAAVCCGCRSSAIRASAGSAASSSSTGGGGGGAGAPGPTSFEQEVAFLREYGRVKVIETPNGGRVAISADHQARVMTSAVEPGGRSLGFVNREFLAQRKTGTQFDNYGGEDRFWLGPEGGQFGLYFPPGTPFAFEHWQTPHALQEGAWTTVRETSSSATFARDIDAENHAGTKFRVKVERSITVLSPGEAAAALGTVMPIGVKWVGFETTNHITNAGEQPWTEAEGLLSVWILGMFAPVPGTRVVVPFDSAAGGDIVNDRYFGKVPAERLMVHKSEGYLLFVCDGRYRSKIGLGSARARPVLGSYSEDANLLTIVTYSKPEGATRYVNSMWEMQKEPYSGDVINSYNDGPPAADKPPLGGFYEIESSSPAAALAPGESLAHVHRTFHFSGPREALDAIATKVLGVTLAQVTR